MDSTLTTMNGDENLPSGQIALPFNEKQLGDFLVGLLGKPQTITKRFNGTFCIDKDSLIDIFHILEQRMHQQNEAKLINFRALISYSDNSTVELSGFDHLVNFNEPLPLVPKAIDLTWQYLIKFKDKEIPEKQEITISFNTGVRTRSINLDFFDFTYFRNTVVLRIAHTARTWGSDIEGLLSKHIQIICKPEAGWKRMLNRNPDTVKKIVQVLILLNTLICSIIWIDKSKVSFLIMLFIGAYLFSTIVDLILENIEPFENPSFILLTKESFKDKEDALKKHKILWIKFIGTIIISLLISILANYLYAYMTKQ